MHTVKNVATIWGLLHGQFSIASYRMAKPHTQGPLGFIIAISGKTFLHVWIVFAT